MFKNRPFLEVIRLLASVALVIAALHGIFFPQYCVAEVEVKTIHRTTYLSTLLTAADGVTHIVDQSPIEVGKMVCIEKRRFFLGK